MMPVTPFLQTLLNQFLHLDSESKGRLQKLEGKVITLELLGVNVCFQLIFLDEKIQLRTTDFLQSDATIKGTPLTLIHMTLSKERHRFFADDVTIEGNLELGQQIIDLFDDLEIDFEEYMSHVIGDVSAHQIGRIVKHFKAFNQRAHDTVLQNINEYLHEEINLVPPQEELQDFFQDVDELRMDVDRLEARIRQLSSKVILS